MITSQKTLTGVLESVTADDLACPEQVSISDSDQAYVVRALQSDAFNVIRGCWKERQEQGLTQSLLASRLNVPEAQVSRWLRRPQNLTLKSLAKLALSMGVVLGFTGQLMENRQLQNYRPYGDGSQVKQGTGSTPAVSISEWVKQSNA